MSALISRQAAIDAIKRCESSDSYDINEGLIMAMNAVAELPAIELPDHGDLIDRDALMARYAEEVKPSNNSDFMRPLSWNDAVQLTELAPVVIPAERN